MMSAVARRLKPKCSSRASLSSTAVPVASSSERSIQQHTVTVHSSLSSDHPIDYARGWAWQQTLLKDRLLLRRLEEHTEDDLDTILLLEHSPVYTLGRGADETHIRLDNRDRLARTCRGPGSARLSVDKQLPDDIVSTEQSVDYLSQIATPVMAPNGVPIYRIDRGGEVTYHGPGQLVVYPLLDLKRNALKQDLHWYLRQVEQVVMDTLQEYDIESTRDEVNTGVWWKQNESKVAAVGVSSSRWITTHGFALNVSPQLDYFDTSYILPCGIDGKGVTSMEQILKLQGETQIPTVAQVAKTVLNKMETVFDMRIEQQTPTEIS